MKTAEYYRKTYPNKTADQIIEALGNEVKDKVETIHKYLHGLKEKDEEISELNNLMRQRDDEYKYEREENGRLGELLKECEIFIGALKAINTPNLDAFHKKITEALKQTP